MKNLGIYIHIPYCLNKCPYCDFYSVTDQSTAEDYVDALLLHMAEYSESASGYDVDTVFIGGGTPTSLPVGLICDIIDGIYDNFNVTEDAEVTIAMNPATAKYADLKRLKRCGVNRLSIGLQSADDEELKRLGRIHTYDEFVESYDLARKAGFENINIDVMYATPGQTKASLSETLNKVIALNPEHISLYGLKIEDGTPFAGQKDELVLPDEDTEVYMYFSSIEKLKNAGYYQYEISNFSKKDKKCLHNLKYWHGEEYLGFGAGAHSYFRDHRYAFKKDIAAYINALRYPSRIPDIVSEDYQIKPSERLGEYVMLNLRLTDGIDTDAFAEIFGLSFERMFGKYLTKYIEGGFMEKDGRFYRFTTKGMFVSNYILSAMLEFNSELISGVVDGSDRA